MRVIIENHEKIIINYVNNKKKRQILTLLLNTFNIKLNIKRKHNIHINLTVFNIKFIKVSRISFYSNNKINTFGFFIKVIKRLKIIKR